MNIVAHNPRESGVHHVLQSGESKRCLCNGRREEDLSVLDRVLLNLVGLVAVQLEGIFLVLYFEKGSGLLDLIDAGEEH